MIAFTVFLTGYVLSQFYRSFLAVIAPELSAELQLSASDLGFVSASWFAAFALSQFAVGTALDRYGPRRTLPALMLFGVAGALLFAGASGAAQAMTAMALIGIGCSASLMGPLFVFARTQSPERFAVLSALIIGLGTLGNLAGGTPLAWAAAEFGWRAVFHALAGLTALGAALIALVIVDPPVLSERGDDGGILSGLREVFALRGLWLVWPLMMLGYGVLITERGLWVGPYLAQVHGLEPIARGDAIFLMALAIALGAFAYGPLESRLKLRKGLALAGSVIAAACLLILAVMPRPALHLAVALLCGFGFAGMTYGTLMSHVRTFLPDRLLGRGMTFANFLCMGGAGALQVGSGAYVDALTSSGLAPAEVYAHVHFALAAALGVPALIYAFARERTPR